MSSRSLKKRLEDFDRATDESIHEGKNSFDDLIRLGQKKRFSLGSMEVRERIWSRVHNLKLDLTEDRRLKLPAAK